MRRGNVVTEVKGWRQASLFTREQLAPFVKRRWQWIKQRLMEEERQGQGAARTRQDDREGLPGLADGPTDPEEKTGC